VTANVHVFVFLMHPIPCIVRFCSNTVVDKGGYFSDISEIVDVILNLKKLRYSALMISTIGDN